MAQAQIMARICRTSLAGRTMMLQRSQGFATASAAGKQSDNQPDLVFDTFKEQQTQYQALLDGSKNLKPPLNGDEAAIKKYASEMEALRKKVGLPEHVEALEAQLEYELQASQGDVRAFLSSAAEGKDLGEFADVIAEVGKAYDATADKPEQFHKKIQDIQAKYKLDSYDKIKDKAILEMYKEQLNSLRAKVTEDMETVKRRDNLGFVDVDPSELKAKSIL